MFTHGFPYTNFHDLNLDWIIKTVKILFNKSVFSINNVEPDDDGNVTITGEELGAIGTVNNIAPVDGNVTLTASDVGAIAQGVGVTKVNGFSPDSSGNVLSGTVRSINGISPASLPTPGNVVLNASDVGALPSTIDPVETVNGISPDAQGNVNVGTVKSVNGSAPDAQGNVNLPTVAGVTSVNGVGPDAQGNVNVGTVKSVNGSTPDANGNVNAGTVTSVNNIAPTNGNVNNAFSTGSATASTGFSKETDDTYQIYDGVCYFAINITNNTGGRAGGDTIMATGFPTPKNSFITFFIGKAGNNDTGIEFVRVRVDGSGNLRFTYSGGMNAGLTMFITGSYVVA